MQQLDLFNKDNDKIAVIRPKKQQPQKQTAAAEPFKEEPAGAVESIAAQQAEIAIEMPEVFDEEQLQNETETHIINSGQQFEDETGLIVQNEEPVIEPAVIEPADEEQPENETAYVELVYEKQSEKKQVQLIKPLSKNIELPSKRGRKSLKEVNLDVALLEIPDDEILFKKQYYSISEVAEWFNMKPSLLRYWENEFDILKPRKNKKGDRLFRPEDVKNLRLIYYLLRQQKYSVEGAKQFLKDNLKKAELQIQLVESLTKLRSFLLELRANLGA